jgi:hypothetical protein
MISDAASVAPASITPMVSQVATAARSRAEAGGVLRVTNSAIHSVTRLVATAIPRLLCSSST